MPPPRYYFFCAGGQTALHVQSAEGDSVSVIDSPEALDVALAGCNRKGNREKALISALKRDHANLRDQLQTGMARGIGSTKLQEAQPADQVNKADKDAIQVWS